MKCAKRLTLAKTFVPVFGCRMANTQNQKKYTTTSKVSRRSLTVTPPVQTKKLKTKCHRMCLDFFALNEASAGGLILVKVVRGYTA